MTDGDDRDRRPRWESPLPERGTLGEFYEEKVQQCLAEAERTKDAALRDRWLTLAIHWKRLARHKRD